MAHYFLFPEKDATIYSHPLNQSLNTGIDEVLTLRDIESNSDLNYYPSRFLIQFKTNEFIDVINNKAGSKNIITASLNLFQTEHRELSGDQHIEVYPLAQSWVNGTGRFGNSPQTTDGVSWKYRDGSDNSYSNTFGTAWGTSSAYLPDYATGSWTDEAPGGGVWWVGDDVTYPIEGYKATSDFSFNENIDLSIDITNPLIKQYEYHHESISTPSGIPNNGFIVKRSGSQEFTTKDDGELNFFSMDTHTIYSPYLDIAWDDSSYDTEVATPETILKTGEIFITLRNNKGEYKTIEEPKFRLNVRELYPTRKFVTTSNYLDVKYFTSKSYYSLVDYATEETVIPFGPTSKLSADSEGMYFKLYMNGLQEERYYKLLFKHENNDGIRVFDENCYFKIVKS
jgi:hypothetical protein